MTGVTGLEIDDPDGPDYRLSQTGVEMPVGNQFCIHLPPSHECVGGGWLHDYMVTLLPPEAIVFVPLRQAI